MVDAIFGRARAGFDAVRAKAGATPLAHIREGASRAPLVIAFTAEPFEYSRSWPANVRLVGPGVGAGASESAAPEPASERPLVLVTCSTEFQDDGPIVEAALAGLSGEDVEVIATTASNDPASFTAPANATVARYLPHEPILRRAACVVCHGGMGITQKALAAGVPVCVVPFGRDQLEVARHVEVAGAGVRLPRSALSADRLRDAVRETMAMRGGAARIAEAFRRAGGAVAAADAIEARLEAPARLRQA